MARYQRWLIAKGNLFAPAPASVAKLVERLRKEGWIASPGAPELAKLRFDGKREQRAQATGGYAVKTVENSFGDDSEAKLAASTEAQPPAITAAWLEAASREELRLVWPVDADAPPPLKYPLTQRPEGPVRYALEVHRADEYIYPVGDGIGAVPTLCRCGEDLAFEWDEDELVPAFERSTGIFTECEECSRTFDPFKGRAQITRPFDSRVEEVLGGAAHRFAIKVDCGSSFVRDASLAFAPELVALAEDEFGRAFHQIGCVS